MNTYINRLIAVVILCQIVTVITPDSERAKQSIRMLCALISLLVFLSPIQNLTAFGKQLYEQIPAVYETKSNSGYNVKELDSIYFLQCITTHYGIEDVSMMIFTDETDTRILQIKLYVKNYPYTSCTVMEKELQEVLNIPVYVYGK